MAESARDAHEHFVIQRRNLVLISIFIIFYKIGKLDIDEINFFGNNVEIGEPTIVLSALSVFFFYFLWRYYTALRGISGWAEFVKSGRVLSDEKYSSMAIESVLRDYNSYSSKPRIVKREWKRVVFETLATPEEHNKPPINIVKEFGLETCYWRVWSYFYAVLSRTSFSDYVFPYFLAALAALELFGFG